MLDVGGWKNRITIKRLTQAQDAYKDVIPTWVTVGTYWAKIEPASGGEKVVASQLRADVSHKVTMGYQGAATVIVPTMRIHLGSRIFNIVSVLDDEERHITLTLYCIEIQGA